MESLLRCTTEAQCLLFWAPVDWICLLLTQRFTRHKTCLITTLKLPFLTHPVSTHLPLVSLNHTSALKIWRTPSFCATLSLPFCQSPNPAMSKCRYCHRIITGSLRRHLAQCGAKLIRAKLISKVTPPRRGRSTFTKGAIHLQISTKHMSSQLAGDTHFATHTRPSNLLHWKGSLREMLTAF